MLCSSLLMSGCTVSTFVSFFTLDFFPFFSLSLPTKALSFPASLLPSLTPFFLPSLPPSPLLSLPPSPLPSLPHSLSPSLLSVLLFLSLFWNVLAEVRTETVDLCVCSTQPRMNRKCFLLGHLAL